MRSIICKENAVLRDLYRSVVTTDKAAAFSDCSFITQMYIVCVWYWKWRDL